MKKRTILKSVLCIFILLVAACVMVEKCVAGQFYPNGYQDCLNRSGGRAAIWSVANYACKKATEKSQNACATWIGPANNSASTTIYASSVNSTVPIALWGMCTDRADTSSAMVIMEDGGSISCGGSCNFTRSGTWGSPSAKSATLNVAKFIQGAGLINGMYCRTVMVDRAHSDGASMAIDFSQICLSLGTPVPEPTPENPETLCRRWAPSGYTSANKYHGTTTVDVRIKNMNSRFGGSGYGDWNNGTIYAMPTDEIGWIECYWAGTPGTGHTKVSSINGGNKTYIDPLRSDWCYNSTSGSVSIPGAGYYPKKNVGSTKQPVTYYELYSKSPVWQNQWSISGAAGVVRSGDSPNGSWSFDRFTNKSDKKRNGYITREGQAGQTFTESGQTGAPRSVNISSSDPSHTINKSYYETTETDYNSPKTCKVKNEQGVEVTVTDGDKCGYNTYQLAHYDGYSCTNQYNNTLWSASVDYNSSSDSASVKIPYNYNNYTGVSLSSGEVYAGETVTVRNVWTIVAPRSNSVTRASYATQVPGAKLKLVAYVSSDENGGMMNEIMTSNSNGCSVIGSGRAKQCVELKNKSGFTLNSGGKLGGAEESHSEMRGEYNAFDASAGDYICIVSAVWPATTAGNTDMSSGGNGQWRYSEPACAVIAKRPTFQVWGGDMYTVGNVSVSVGQKRNIYHAYFNSWNNLGSYKKTGGSGSAVKFSSWVEEGLVIRDGITRNLASGAAIARNNSSPAGAGNTADFCTNMTALTFANGGSVCNSSGVGRSGIGSGVSDRDSLIDYWIGSGTRTKGSCGGMWGGSCTLIESATGKNIRYVTGGNMSVSGTIPANTTYLVKSSGTVTITGNLVYSGTYSSLTQIPKVIIYANNVNIQCGVSEVDAIIITAPGGNVNTCSNASGGYDGSERSRQLKIFGMVIADSVTLGRTYGAAANRTGASADPSGMPSDGAAAEIFDYDSSIWLWSEFMAGSGESDTLQTTYQHELAPRY